MRKTPAAVLTAFLVLLLPSAPTTAATTESVVGAPQKIYGPSGYVDSLYSTVRDGKGRLHGYLSNSKVLWFDQRSDGSLTNRRVVLSGGGPGSVDQCGVHPVGTIYKDPAAPRSHWITFYHAEKAAPVDDGRCNHWNRHTRWSIVRMETFNGGRSWSKRGQVITQDRALLTNDAGGWSYSTDDAGSPRLVITDGFMYLFFRSVTRTSNGVQRMNVARAPLRSMGRATAWKKYFNGAWTESGLGGQATALEVLPAAARGISFNTHLNRWVAVRVDIAGIRLFQSTVLGRGSDSLLTWKPYRWVVDRRGQPTESAWHRPCGRDGLPVAYGYGSIVGLDGSSSKSGKSFWVYYMKKPDGKCFSDRYLYRRQVTLP